MQGVSFLQCHGPIHASWIWYSNPKKVWLCSFSYYEGAHGTPQTLWCVLPFSSLLLLVFNTFSPKGLFDDSHWLFKVLFNWIGVATASLNQFMSSLLFCTLDTIYTSVTKKKMNGWIVMCGGQRTVFRDQFLSLLCWSRTLVSATLLTGGWLTEDASSSLLCALLFAADLGWKMHTTASVLFLMWVWRIKYWLPGFPGQCFTH